MADENLSAASLTWALNHIVEYGDNDLFPPLFEFDLVKKYWHRFENLLTGTPINHYKWQTPRQWLIPKDQVSFRTGTQLDPVDSIVFTALVHDLAPDLEKLRIPVADETIYSYRVSTMPGGALYEPHTRRAFWSKSKELARQYHHVAILDITDFYNQIDHAAVLNQLEAASISAPRRTSIQNLLQLVSNNTLRGIAIGPQASHLLAEASLIPLDNFLHAQYRFTRYADDIHVFCATYEDAQAAIFQIADYLNKHQKLSLNRQKTDIKTKTEFRESASRMLIDDPINHAEKKMLNALRRSLQESGEIDADDYSELHLSDLDQADIDLFTPDLIKSVLEAYLNSESTSYLRLRWFLRRITQIGASGAVEYVASQIERFAPAIVDAVRYLSSAAVDYSGSWKTLGTHLIKSLNNPLIRASDYLQVSIIGLFWRITDLNHIKRLIPLYTRSSASIRREIILAASAQVGPDWVRQHINQLSQLDDWLRRAVLHAMRLLPEGERRRYAAKNISTPEQLMTNCLLNVFDGKEIARTSTNFRPTIGIITALPKEMAAVRTFLSNPERATMDRPGGMKECYLGEIQARHGGKHRVAVALSGLGNNQASARATNLLRDFPTIKHIFMVGIAGGVPDPRHAEKHVRLGDIVVSGEHGVKQFDLVKEAHNGVEHREPPRPPSASILEAVRFLESELLVRGHNSLLIQVTNGLQGLGSKRPSGRYDVLADSKNPSVKIRHPRDKSRRPGEPKIFIAPIASSNVLLKNPEKRNMLRDKYGVRAIEMEGSGIADATWNLEVDYIVIRGICDYCDANKGDLWQEYAAIVAAAYTRILLESLAADSGL
ncbi:MAG TPA: reverse transcriptase domain-containing protein [Terriglobales bacterium]|jgi:nucleoside phosphorylase|nr:reverse transcriptase domain-containing protein [Terriglobales bacterium]